MRLPFSSLRANLIAAFAAIIALSLLLASAGFVYLLRDYQVQREKERLESFALSTSVQVVRAIRARQSLTEIEAQVEQTAAAARLRFLLLDERGVVVFDTDQNKLAGSAFAPPGLASRRPGIVEGIIETPSGEAVFGVFALGQPGGPATMRVAVIAPERTLADTWRELLPQLAVAAVGALLVSAAFAWWLASSITRPLMQITRASEEMARGHYEHELQVPETNDEVGRLARAFGVMVREVARSHRAMRDLLANVSHDLRTPLTSIQGFAGALVDGTLTGEEGAREAGQVIGEEAERMRRLLEDLLYLGRIESGELPLAREALDLADLARAADLRFRFRAEERDIHLHLEASAPVPVVGDGHRLAQVVDNLLVNAFKHTPAGGEITISARIVSGGPSARGARPGRLAALSVHNTGSYIRPREQERVFERFYQVDRARANPDGGRGLGLAIAREIVQAHHGVIQLESSEAAGTTFTVRLPLGVIETGAPAALTSASAEAAGRGAAAASLASSSGRP